MTIPPAPLRIVPKLKAEIAKWLDRWTYTRFVTLATNDPSMGQARLPGSKLAYGVLRDRLREWDGRMNHAILGKQWAKHHADRMWAVYFLEKPNSNPHWHGLVGFAPVDNRPETQQQRIFDEHAERIWKKLVPSGTVDVQPVTVQQGALDYVAKLVPYRLSYEMFVTPDEFMRG